MNVFSLMQDHPLPKGVLFIDKDKPEEKAAEALEKGLTVVWPVNASLSSDVLRPLAEKHGERIFPFAPLLETPRVLYLERILRSGEAGEIGIATHRRAGPGPDALDAALNDIALIRRFLGGASQVFATRVKTETGDFLTVCLALKSGAIASVVSHVDRRFLPRFAFDYSGRKGNLVHDGNEDVTPADGEYSPDEARGLKRAWMDLLLRLEQGSGASYSIQEWMEDLETAWAVQKSAGAFAPRTLRSQEVR
jgi:predicted dehydrogenase